MAVNFNTQQQQAISEYRVKNNLGYVISDEEVLNQMQNAGKLPSCFDTSIFKLSPKPAQEVENTPGGGGAASLLILLNHSLPALHHQHPVPLHNLLKQKKKPNLNLLASKIMKVPVKQ